MENIKVIFSKYFSINFFLISTAICAQDIDNDGTPDTVDPNVNSAVAVNDMQTIPLATVSEVYILDNDDFIGNSDVRSVGFIELTNLGTGSAGGTVKFNVDRGTLRYTPLTSEAGTNVSINYRVCNTLANPNVCASATLNLTIMTNTNFVCTNTAYVISAPNNTTSSTLGALDLQAPETPSGVITLSAAGTYNALAFNTNNNLLYAIQTRDFDTTDTVRRGDLVTISPSGVVVSLGKPVADSVATAALMPTWPGSGNVANSQLNLRNFIGTIDSQTETFLTFAQDNVDGTRYIAKVDLNAFEYSFVQLDRNINPADVAFSNQTGLLYGVNGTTIRSYNPTTGEVLDITVDPSSDTLISSAGGAWSDANGNVYFYKNGGTTGNVILFYNVTTNVAKRIGEVTPFSDFDAAACTPPVITKSASGFTFAPGSTFTYTFEISNTLTTVSNVGFSDVLTSSEFSFVPGSIVPANPGGGTITNFTINTIEIENIIVPAAGSTTFDVQIAVSSSAEVGSFSNTGFVSFGPQTISSDDPRTLPASSPDPTVINIVRDADGDGITDNVDLDDDNDAILDEVECPRNFLTISAADLGLGSNESNVSVVNVDVSSKFGLSNGNVVINAENIYTNNSGEFVAGNPAIITAYSRFDFTGTSQVFLQLIHDPVIAQDASFDGIRSVDGTTYFFSGSLTTGFSNIQDGNKYLVQRNTSTSSTSTSFIWESEISNVQSFEVITTDEDTANPTQPNAIYEIRISVAEDFDGDGIPNCLDLDSDNDNCADAVEGAGGFAQVDLVTAAGSVSGGTGSIVNQNLSNLPSTVDSTPGSITFGVPIIGPATTAVTQGIDESQDGTKNSQCCEIIPPTLSPN